MLLRLLLRLAGNVAALWVASGLLDGVTYADDFGTLVLAALVLTLANWAVRPVVTLLALPLIILTLGVALFFVNLAMIELTAWLVNGFAIDGFWTAVGATVIVWVVNMILSSVAHDERRRRERSRERAAYRA
jgi:putative membrane protein